MHVFIFVRVMELLTCIDSSIAATNNPMFADPPRIRMSDFRCPRDPDQIVRRLEERPKSEIIQNLERVSSSPESACLGQEESHAYGN
jgi:hypothetical protein